MWWFGSFFEKKISKEEALSIAKRVCDQENWGWEEPIFICSGWGVWRVRTNADSRGRNAAIVIRKRDGTVLAKGFIPR